MTKISFLIAAHNEEKIIEKTLKKILGIPYNNFEIIVGLDGCTDNTEKIIKKLEKQTKKIKHYNLNLREGKPAVINSLIKKTKGEIIIINDADWLFQVKSSEKFKKFVSVFENPQIGGIAESFPAEWHKDRLAAGDLGYKMEAYSSYLWYNFQKDRFTVKKDGLRYVTQPNMFLTNIFRKKLYEENFSLGDDFERTCRIFEKGYEIVLFDDQEMPRIKTTYDKTSVKDLFKQKVRTAIAREQLNSKKIFEVNTKNYYLPSVIYIFKESWKMGFDIGVIISLWIIITSLATFVSKFKRMDTKEGWKIRLKR